MKFLAIFFLAGIASAATFTLSSSDPRCDFPMQTCTFTAAQQQPNDYGVVATVTLAGGGTWSVSSESPTTCSSALVSVFNSAPAWPLAAPVAATTISTSGVIYIAPVAYVAAGCALGTYTHTITFTSSISGTYALTVKQVVINRMAAPVYLNACGVDDPSLAGGAQGNCPGGQSQVTNVGNTYAYDTNVLPCSDCRPGGPFSMPSPGGTFRGNLGELYTVITPPCFNSSGDTDKSNMSVGNLWIVAQSLGCASPYDSGMWFVFPSTGSATPSYSFTTGGCCNGTFAWSNDDDVTLYFFSDPVAFSGLDTVFKHVTLGTAPVFTTTTDYTMPYATYGRGLSTNFSHQDMNKHDWYPMNTVWDYRGQVSVSGTSLTWVSGQVFDTQKFLDQQINTPGGILKVIACADTHHCTLSASAATQTNVAATANVPYLMCAFNPVQMASQGAAYVPTCADLTTLARPHVNGVSGTGASISHNLHAGKFLVWLGQYPSNIPGSFDPNDTASMTLGLPALQMSPDSGYQFGSQCFTAAQGDDSLAPGAFGYCVPYGHQTSWETSDGKDYIVNGLDGAALQTQQMDTTENLQVPYSYQSGQGNFFVPMWTQSSVGGEFGAARKSPYMLTSTGINFTLTPTAFTVTNCTNTNPMVVTVTATMDTGINSTTHNKVLIGGVLGNTACNGSQTVTAATGVNHEIWTLSAAGNGAYVSFGAATEDVTYSHFADGDADQLFLIREQGQEIRRFGHSRSVAYNDPFTDNYWAVPRWTLSMDAKYAVGTSNNGQPESSRVVMVTTGVDNGIGMTPSKFDSTHSVTSATSLSTTGTIVYSTPDTGDTVVDVCQTLRWPDRYATPQETTSPDLTCVTTTNTSGANPRTSTVTVAAGTTYYYRIVANNKWTAWGTLSPAVSPYSGTSFAGPFTLAGPRTVK